MPRGCEHYRSRFNEREVVAIREAHARGDSYAALGRRYGARSDTIRNLCLGYTYANVGGPLSGPTARRRTNEDLARQVKEAHNNGVSYQKLCAQFDIGMATAHRLVRDKYE